MNINLKLTLLPLVAAALLGGCAAEPTLTERNFGDSVRQMVRAQTYDPSTLSSPSEEPVEGIDGQLLEGAIEAYRNSTSDPAAVGNEVTINVGSGQ